jgi:hypothetical protein
MPPILGEALISNLTLLLLGVRGGGTLLSIFLDEGAPGMNELEPYLAGVQGNYPPQYLSDSFP